MADSIYSWLIGLSDNAYYLDRASRGVGGTLFKDGWGDIQNVLEAYRPMLSRLETGVCGIEMIYGGGKTALQISWNDTQETEQKAQRNEQISCQTGTCCSKKSSRVKSQRADEFSVDAREGAFLSPYSSILPPEASQCRFLLVIPSSASDAWRPWMGQAGPAEEREVVIITPATGEQGYGDRLKLARQFARSRGAVSILVMAPFYASRKPAGQKGTSISTVGRYLAQSLAIMSEAAALATWVHACWPISRICMTGFSWGAAMAGCGGLLSIAALPVGVAARQLCVAPFVGSCSPAPVVDGILAGDIAWAALAADGRACAAQLIGVPGVTQDMVQAVGVGQAAGVRAALLGLLDAFSNKDFVVGLGKRPEWCVSTPLLASVSSCTARHDWFLPRQYAVELHRVLAALVSGPQRARQVWLVGGHLAAYFARPVHQSDAVEWALDVAATNCNMRPAR